MHTYSLPAILTAMLVLGAGLFLIGLIMEFWPKAEPERTLKIRLVCRFCGQTVKATPCPKCGGMETNLKGGRE